MRFKDSVKLAKREYFEKLATQSDFSRDPLLRNIFCQVKAKHSPVIVSPSALAKTFGSIWKALPLPEEQSLQEEIVRREASPPPETARDAQLCAPFTLAEAVHAVKLCKPGKAPGFDGHDYRMLRCLPESALRVFVSFANSLWDEGPLPESWLLGWLKFLPKSEVSSPNPSDYRPITLLSVWFKLLERMLWHRLLAWQPAWAPE